VYRFHAGYGMNWYNSVQGTDMGAWIHIGEADIPRPAETIYIPESNGSIVTGPNPAANASYSYANWRTSVSASPRHWLWNAIHNDGANIVFCDGHGKWMKHENAIEDLWNPRD